MGDDPGSATCADRPNSGQLLNECAITERCPHNQAQPLRLSQTRSLCGPLQPPRFRGRKSEVLLFGEGCHAAVGPLSSHG